MTGLPPLLVVAAILSRRDRVLLTRRPPGSSHAGCWEFPGGKVEPGESAAEAVVREIGEELAILVRPLALHGSALRPGPGRSLVLASIEVETRTRHAEPTPTDGREMGWFSPEEIDFRSLPTADRPLLRCLLADRAGRRARERWFTGVDGRDSWVCRTGKGLVETIEPLAPPPGWECRSCGSALFVGWGRESSV